MRGFGSRGEVSLQKTLEKALRGKIRRDYPFLPTGVRNGEPSRLVGSSVVLR